jgi:hypothetical protein
MILSLRNVGGFGAATRRATVIDTNSLTASDSASIMALVSAGNFFQLPEEIPGDLATRDGFGTVFDIEDGARKHTVEFDLPTASPDLRDLVELLHALAFRKS